MHKNSAASSTTHRSLKPGLVGKWRLVGTPDCNLSWRLLLTNNCGLVPPWVFVCQHDKVTKLGFKSRCVVFRMDGDLFHRFTVSLGAWNDTWHCSQGWDCVARWLKWRINFCPWIVLDLWLWEYFRLRFLNLFGRLSWLRCSALFSLYEWRVGNLKNHLKRIRPSPFFLCFASSDRPRFSRFQKKKVTQKAMKAMTHYFKQLSL